MPTQVQFRRGSQSQNNNFKGAAGEISVNTDTNSLRVHNGITTGGFELARADLANVSGISTNAGVWVSGSTGIYTGTKVGIGTTIPRYDLHVIGSGTTALFVDGNARITGILTVGNSSITFDGTNNNIVIGTGVTVYGNTGIISASAIYVAGANISGSTGYASTAGIATYATRAGLATYSATSGVSTYASTAGIATYATSSGVSTYSTTAGIATYATSSGISTYASTAGVSTTLTATASVNTTGIITATKFVGDGSGLTNIVSTGSGVQIRDNGTIVGTASTIDFGDNLTVAFGAGIMTVTAPAGSEFVRTSVGIHTLGNVGVGTTNPKTKLEINGVLGFSTVNSNIRIGDDTTGTNLTTGYNNIFIGSGVGNSAGTAYDNVSIGYQCGYLGISTTVAQKTYGVYGPGVMLIPSQANQSYVLTNRSGNLSGTGFGITLYRNSSGYINSWSLNNGGSGFVAYERIIIPGNLIGGSTPTNDIMIVVQTVSSGVVQSIFAPGENVIQSQANQTYTVTNLSGNLSGTGLSLSFQRGALGQLYGSISNGGGGINFSQYEVVTVPGTSIGGSSPADDVKVSIDLIVDANRNVRIGYKSGYKFGGCNNIFLGSYSGYSNHKGCENSFFGDYSGCSNISGNQNNFFGAYSGKSNTTGNWNIFAGYQSGYCNTTGPENTIVGAWAGYYNTTGGYNAFFGSGSGHYNQTGSFNTFLGNYTGLSTSASYKVVIGSGELWGNNFDSPDTTKDKQLAIGVRTDANAANYWLVGDENFNIGIGTTNPQTKLQINGTLGFEVYGASGIYTGTNILIGDVTTGANLQPDSLGYGANNIFMGIGAGSSTTTGYYNNFFGKNSGYNNTTGYYNNFSGFESGYNNIVGCDNNFLGNSAGYYNTTGSFNNFFGERAGNYNTIGYDNIFIGRRAGYGNTSGNDNISIGRCAGFNNSTGSWNIFIGSFAGCNNTEGATNNFFGYYAGLGNTLGKYNAFFGNSSGRCNQTGSYNVFFGEYTGSTTDKSHKVIIGSGTYTPLNLFDAPKDADKQFAVGLNTTGTAEYWLVGDENFNIGIGTTNPTEKLSVGGSIQINDTTVYGSVQASTASTIATGIHSGLSTSVYRSVEYTIQATEGTNYQAIKVLAIHDGTNAYDTQYGNIYNTEVATFDVDISGGNVRLVAAASSTSTTNYTVNFIATKI